MQAHLQVVHGVPVVLQEDDGVGRRQVQPQAAHLHPQAPGCCSSGRWCMQGRAAAGMRRCATPCKSRQPTAVVSSMTSIVGSALKRCTRPKRRLVSTPPSRRSQLMPLGARTCPGAHEKQVTSDCRPCYAPLPCFASLPCFAIEHKPQEPASCQPPHMLFSRTCYSSVLCVSGVQANTCQHTSVSTRSRSDLSCAKTSTRCAATSLLVASPPAAAAPAKPTKP
jgi:hypothetical protein